MPDIDLDLPDRKKVLDIMNHIPASIQNKKHNTGVYFQNIPYDPINEISSIDYREAEKRGYFKIDLLNVNIYKHSYSKLPPKYKSPTIMQGLIPKIVPRWRGGTA